MTPLVAPRTVIEAFLSPTESAPLADVYDTANLAGIADQPVRLTIRRMISGGEVEQTGRGRAGTLELTESGRRRLERDRQSLTLVAAQDAGDAPWVRRWQLIAVTAPERERAVRDTLRRELLELGAVAVSTGLYVSAHDLAAELPDDVRPYLSTATTDDLDVRGVTDPRAIAEALWPSAPLLAAYSLLDDALRTDASDTAAPAEVRMLVLADALERAIRHDPLLPPELREEHWAPTATRAVWAERWRVLSEASGNRLYRDWPRPASPRGVA